MSSAAALSAPISTAASSISQKRRAGMPRKITGAAIPLRVTDLGGVGAGCPDAVAAATRSNVYQSAAPPSYSTADHCVVATVEPSAKPYSMRTGDHESAPAGSLKSDSYQTRQAWTTGSTDWPSAALSAS